VKLVYGTLDDSDVLTKEASKADIVAHWADADHAGAAEAIISGLEKRKENGATGDGFLVHTSGTGVLTWETFDKDAFGVLLPKVFDDWDGVREVTMETPDRATHRNVDKIVLAGNEKEGVKTAIVCPPCIYGPGRGPGNTRSMQAYNMTKAVLESKKGFIVGKGENGWTEVHVQDLSKLYVALIEAAAEGGGKATWSAEEGYYFAENGELRWGDISRRIASVAHEKGFLNSAECETISPEKANDIISFGQYMWSTNSRCKAVRARKLLNWNPTEKSLWDEIPDIVDSEAVALGLIKGHAEKAAGLA
jgi:nucleoside-diphosphate-sugar epimerase